MKITHTTPPVNNITLADITKKRVELKQRITLQKEKIAETYEDIFTPITHITSRKSFMNHFKTGINLFNGIVLGYKLMTKLRKYFHKNR